MPTSIKYRVDRTDPNNKVLRTTAEIAPAEEILTEEPLLQVPVALSSMYDDLSFYAALEERGSQDVFRMQASITEANRKKFDSLFPLNGTFLDRVKKNAFGHVEKNGSEYDFHVITVYDKISRANHPCRPNDVVTY